jgi:hypothetical protein
MSSWQRHLDTGQAEKPFCRPLIEQDFIHECFLALPGGSLYIRPSGLAAILPTQ